MVQQFQDYGFKYSDYLNLLPLNPYSSWGGGHFYDNTSNMNILGFFINIGKFGS